MNFELMIVLGMIVLATSYITYSSWNTWFSKKAGCGGGCGCGKKTVGPSEQATQGKKFIPLEQLKLRSSENKPL